MSITVEQLVESLNRTGLMTPAEIAAFQEGLPKDKKPIEPEAFAKELVRQKKLTPYQGLLLAQGQGNSLVLGEYTLLEKIGEGGMGIVCRAQHRRLKRQAAIKILHPAVTKSEDAVKRFRREAEAMTRLSHPNIVAAYDANEQEGSLFVVMELVQGTDLFRLVKNQGPLPVPQAVDYLIQAARGLDHAHKKGIVHRDIKPSNLLLDNEGTIKILDMGLVRFMDSAPGDVPTGADGLTQTGDIMGSFDYMAPEQAIDTKRADHHADQYSLGVTFWYLLTGKTMYAGETSMQKLLAHRENAIPSLRRVRDDVPLALEAVFHRMVAKKPEDRYPSMAELIQDLEACLEPPSSVLASEPWEPSAGTRRPGSAGRVLIVCGTICIVTALVVNAVVAHESASNRWIIPDEAILVKWFAYFQGTAMVALGAWMSLLGARLGVFGAMLRWLIGVCGGILAGGIVGILTGWFLATSTSDLTRSIGGATLGALAGAAIGGRRAWITIPVLALVGYFAGGWIGKSGLSLWDYGLDFQMNPRDTAIAVCGLLVAFVGAMLAARFGSDRRRRKKPKSTDDGKAGPLSRPLRGLAGSETIRRVPGKST